MTFDAERHHRRSIRLPGYDYRRAGAYYVTICVHQRRHLFGSVVEEGMILNEAGKLVESQWLALPGYFPFVALDLFVVMPDHMHGIIWIGEGAYDPTTPLKQGFAPPAPQSLSAIMRSFKSVTARKLRRHDPSANKIWQRDVYEHILRDEDDLQRRRVYIAENPQRWAERERRT
jgi:putative transposase